MKRTENLRKWFKKRWFWSAAVVALCSTRAVAINLTPQEAATAPVTVSAQVSAGARFSPGIAEILKMADAKVDVGVIKAYIRNSPTAYNPTANEIVVLKERGLSDEILTAMLQRGGELRA